MEPRLADRIREHVLARHVLPARQRGATLVTLNAGDVHEEMGLSNRMPAVCSTIEARKFAEQASATLVQRTGPHQGASVKWQFRLD